MEREPDLVGRFVEATVRGYEVAAEQPDEAAEILVAENPGVFEANPDLPAASQRFLAEEGYLVDAEGRVGTQTLERWTGYSRFLFEAGLLTGPDGQPLAEEPDYAALFTTDLLPEP
jgi:ABC-type nitrate/sulfonate/bicarbonate transport system substrate-binding protein